ncbi:MAG: 2-dehydro-3-deoxygluconokinase, partial [uncultured Chloroflexia bacterium]
MAEPRFDLTTFGETMLRLSVPQGDRLERVLSLDVTAGGAESNVAIAVSRMGKRVAWTSRLPVSPLGRRIERSLRIEGVDTSMVRWVDQGRVGTYFIEFAPPPRRIEVVYDRRDSAASQMTAADFDWDRLLDTRVLHLTGITPGLSKACLEATAAAIKQARERGIMVSFDVNYRARLWSPDEARDALLPLLRQASLVICGTADAQTLFGLSGEPESVLDDLQQLTQSPGVVLTRGDQGSLAREGSGTIIRQSAIPTQIVDRIGAGDAFSAGVLCGILEGSLAQGLRYGTAMSAHKLTTFGDVML